MQACPLTRSLEKTPWPGYFIFKPDKTTKIIYGKRNFNAFRMAGNGRTNGYPLSKKKRIEGGV